MIRKSSSLQQTTTWSFLQRLSLLMELSTHAQKSLIRSSLFMSSKNGQQFPLAYCVLPDKTHSSYQRTFTLLKEKAEQLHLEFSPNVVLTDFELAIIQAAELSFPAETIKGCYYHYCQCLNRKIQQIGLQVAYRKTINSIDLLWGRQQLWHLCHLDLYDWHGKQLNLKHLNYPELRSSSHIMIMKRHGSWETSVYNLGMFLTAAQLRTNNHVERWHSCLKKVEGGWKSPSKCLWNCWKFQKGASRNRGFPSSASCWCWTPTKLQKSHPKGQNDCQT